LLLQTCQADATAPQQLGQASPGELADILLVEDEPNDVDLTLLAFKRAKIANRIQVVRDGEQALEYLFRTGKYAKRADQGLPTIILLDLNLPKLSGMQVLARLKAHPRTQRISVIVLTVSQNSPYIQESRRLGADAYMVKPVNFQSFSRVTPQLRLLWALLHPALVTGGGS
jgi:CheY-like chemotaxis protein